MITTIYFLSTLLFASTTFAFGCFPDQVLSQYPRYENQKCTAPGYCYTYDLNPDNGKYEYYYGYHYQCDGDQERIMTYYTCQRDDGSVYNKNEAGHWSICRIR